MNPHIQHIIDIIQQIENVSDEQKTAISKSLKEADKELAITSFKLERTERVKRTTAILLEETIDELEQKRKAAQIEAALERVRSRSLAMHHSDELEQVAVSLFEAIVGLGIAMDGALLFVFDRKKRNITLWVTIVQLTTPVLIDLPYEEEMKDNEIILDYWKATDHGLALSKVYTGEAKNEYFRYVQRHNSSKITDQTKELLIGLPAWHLSFAAEKNTMLGLDSWSGHLFTESDLHTLRKFVRAFEQAYVRFLDLQKAEAQAREAQIQLSLERIRAKAMAMQHSDELSGFLTILFEQFDLLNLNPVFCHLSLLDIDNNRTTYRTTGKKGSTLIATQEIDFYASPIWKQKIEDWKAGHSYDVDVMHIPYESFPEMAIIFKEILEKLPENERPLPEDFPNGQYVIEGSCKFGYLGYSASRPPLDEEKEITRRIANEFGNVYQRFLDLQKAEAQARESEIEVALEKVRSRSLAMHKSDDLKDVVFSVFERLRELQIQTDSTSIVVYLDESAKMELWTANDMNYPTKFNLPMTGGFYPIEAIELRKEQKVFLRHIPFEEKNKYWKELFNTTDFRKVPEARKNFLLEKTDCLIQLVAFGKVTGIMLFRYFNNPFSDAEIEITERFVKVFDQAYTRFLDLQKAEAQAREAQIQLSLERIRAKAMAMQHSDELSGFLTVLFEQFAVLNLSPVNCHLHFFDIDNNRSTFRLTGKNGSTLIATQEIDLNASPAWNQKVEDLKSGHPKEVDSIYIPYENISEIGEIFKEILEKLPEGECPLPEDYPNGEYITEGYCKYGYLGYSASRPPSDEEKEITRRIAYEFGNVYQRFLDLQKAEAQAREAQIQLSLERIRAKAMAMQHTDELSEFLTVLFEQFEVLNLKPVFCHLSFFDIENNRFTYRMTGRTGAAVIATQEIDFEATPIWKQNVEDWKSGHPYQVGGLYIPKERIPEMTEIFNEILEKLPEDERPLMEDFPDGQYVVDGYCKYGYLGYSAGRPPSDEEKEITRRIANEFGNVYQRFLDLEKAEAQAKEAQIQLSLERIRAKAMAMQHSDELSDFLTVLFEQFEVLNLRPVNCILSLFDFENNRSTFRMTGKKGATLIASQEIDLDASPVWKQKVENWKSGHPNDVDVLYIPYENLPEIAEIFKEILEKLPEDERPLPGDYPDGEYIIDGYCKYGYLGYAASGPPSDEEKEITRRIANEFGNVYQRVLDLQKAEAQAKEAQIEAALERVRSRTMAMQHSDELTDVAGLLFNQVSALGIKTWTTGFNVWSEDNNSYVDYLSFGEGFIEPNTVHTEKAEALRDVSNARKSGVEFEVLYVEGEKLKQLYLALTKWDQKQYEKLLQDGVIPSHQYEHFVFGSKVSLMFITYEPVPEAHDTFKRLGKVFEQTYTRFLDLQKAEAQTREVQIQLALERVRARTMAMQKSDELAEVSYLLNKQVVELGIPTRGCAFNIYNEHDSTEWFSNLEGTIPAYKTPRENIFLKYYEVGQQGETLLIEEFGGERIKEHYRYLATLSVSGKKDKTIHEDVSVVPEYQIDHVAYFKYGYLLFITLGSALQAHEVFKRFAKEFEQTYTRFLDLKKAEAQTREAHIEAALERVRSRTMAMHRSDELKETAVLLFQQVVALGVPAFGTGFNIWDDDLKFATAWMGGEDRIQPPFKTSSSEDIFLRIYEAGQKGDSLFVEEQGGEALKSHYEYMNSIPVFKEIADKMAEAGQSFPTFQIMHCAFFSHGYLMFISYNPVPDAYDIFKRFAKVFEQTYTRFLDLQRAETQAREAQIEAALERVRSKAMAMHSSEGLNATIAAFYRELEQFSITPRRCGVGLLQKNRIAELSTMNTMEYGNSIEIIGILKMEGHWVLNGVYENWILQKEFHPVLRGNEIKEYNQLLRPQVAFPEYPNDSAQFGYFFFFPEGGVYAWTEKEMKEDELNIYRRFTKVLSLTYKRYKDLKDAEANALEAMRRASLDRVRAEIASMRTVDDLQRITPIIWHELTSLGVPFVRCGVFIIDEATEHIQVHLSSPDGSALGAFDLPFNSSELTLNSVNHWRQGIIFKTHWNKQEFLNFMHSMIKLGQISNPETYQGATQPPESLHLHFVPFKQGMLYVGNTAPLEKEVLELVKSLAESFSIAYARYEDFRQLESAKNQIEKTFTELKAAQAQLIQAEKMASLGELTAGIAHEIQNPLNFVNNFSEISKELLAEMKEELVTGSKDEAITLAEDVILNLEKINHHGKRADAIVKGMLQHSRTSNGLKEPTDINALTDEFLRLSYHGMRAKDKSLSAGKAGFNADFETDFDPTLPKINVIPQDIGRVLLNLINNAFYEVHAKTQHAASLQQSPQNQPEYKPMVVVSTKHMGTHVEIRVKDNGPGISAEIKDKIFQPFFTTKPSGQGTGLGLSLSYDIVKAHGGELKADSMKNGGSQFIIQIPIS